MIEAYQGTDPYAFVSYAHADSEAVFREIERMTRFGVRIWYDEGIDPGNDWPDEIGRALDGAALLVVFISPRSAVSRNVQNEINFALNRGKPLLAVHLEETRLPVGLELRMGDIQAILMYSLDEEHYVRKLQRSLPPELRTVAAASQSILAKRVWGPLEAGGHRSVSLRLPSRHGERNICLLGDGHCSLGRDRSNDIVLRVLPRSPENDVQSRQISGHHASLSITADSVTWKNANCSNGTTIDARPLGAHEELRLHAGTTIQLAKVLTLRVDEFDGPHFDSPADFSALNDIVSRTVAMIPEGSINAVALHRTDGLRNLEQYVLVRRGALLGRGPTCAVRIDHPSISNRHARIYCLRGGLWIEPMDDAAVVVVNGRRITTDELAALAPGTEVMCGTVTIQVTPRFQQELGLLDVQMLQQGSS